MKSNINSIESHSDSILTPYPSELVSQKIKLSKDYGLKYVKAILNHYLRRGQNLFYNKRKDYEDNLKMILGDDDIELYKRLIDPRGDLIHKKDNCKDDISYVNIDWSLLKIAYKYLEVLIGKFDKVGWELQVEAIDDLAFDEKEDYKNRVLAYNELIKMNEELATMLPPQLVGKEDANDIPKNLDEIEVDLLTEKRLKEEIEMEQAIQVIDEVNEYEQLQHIVSRNLAYFDIAGIKSMLDSNGFPKHTAINPFNLIVSNTSDERFSDMQHVGELSTMTIADLRQAAGDQFSEDEYVDIVEKARNSQLNQSYANNQQTTRYYHATGEQFLNAFDHLRIEIFYFYFYSTDEWVYEARNKPVGEVSQDFKVSKLTESPTTKNGTPKNYTVQWKGADYKKGADYLKDHPDREIIRTKVKNVYKGIYITGTDYVFNYGLMYDMERVKDNLTDTKLPFTLFCPGMINGRSVSFLDQIKPIMRDIQENWFRYKNALSNIIPTSYEIDLAYLQGVKLTLGGKEVSTEDILDMYYSGKGLLVNSTEVADAQLAGRRAVNPITSPALSELQGYWSNMMNGFTMIEKLTGMNYATDGSTPPDRAGKAVTQLMGYAADNVLSSYYLAKKYIREQYVMKSLDLALESIRRGAMEGALRKSIGKNGVKVFKASAKCLLHQYGVKFTPAPTDEMWAEFRMMVKESLAAGMITLSDALFIEEVQHYKLAKQILRVREDKVRKQKQQESLQQQQMNQEMQMQSAQQAQQAMQMQSQLETQAKIAVMQAETIEHSKRKSVEVEAEKTLMMLRIEEEHQKQMVIANKEITKEEIKAESNEDIARIKVEAQKQKDYKEVLGK